jgi:hypothetical protein
MERTNKMVSLTPNEVHQRDNLIEKFRNGPLSVDEAESLKSILEKEKRQAIELGDIVLLFGIGLLLGVVIDYIANEKSSWKKLFSKK